jgi:uncharacterized protein
MSQLPADIVMSFLQALWRGDRAASKAPFADDAEWWFLPSLPYPRPLNAKVAIDNVLDDMISAFDPSVGLHVDVHSVMTDGGGEVAADYSARSTTRSGKAYANRYVLRATVKDGKIICVRPYTDTQYLSQLFSE